VPCLIPSYMCRLDSAQTPDTKLSRFGFSLYVPYVGVSGKGQYA